MPVIPGGNLANVTGVALDLLLLAVGAGSAINLKVTLAVSQHHLQKYAVLHRHWSRIMQRCCKW